jgi:hypothetical protein
MKKRTDRDKDDHPYQDYESLPVWNVLNNAIEDLIQNQDILEQTKRELIVGFLCKRLRPHLKQVDKAD